MSEFEKKDLFDPNNIAALIDKSKVDSSTIKVKKTDKITQDQDSSIIDGQLSVTEELALQAQIFTCWSVPFAMPYLPEDMLVRVKLILEPDGTIEDMEMLDHKKMNTPGKERFRTYADSVRRALQLCNPLRMPATGYERWKTTIFNFDATDMVGG